MNRKLKENARYLILTPVAIVILFPLYILFVYSFKSSTQIVQTGIAFPTQLYLGNFVSAFKNSNIVQAFINTVISACGCTFILVISSSMAAYIISRKNTKFYNTVYYIYLSAISIPFQVVMMPLYKQLYTLGMVDSLWGYVLASAGTQIAYNVFLYSGFVKGIPKTLDEAAYIDGANQYVIFWKVIFPLMKPIVITGIVLNIIHVWNNLLLALIMLQHRELETLTLLQYSFISQYSTDLGSAFAAFTISIIPIVILYLFLQKYIVSGITAGAVKS